MNKLFASCQITIMNLEECPERTVDNKLRMYEGAFAVFSPEWPWSF